VIMNLKKLIDPKKVTKRVQPGNPWRYDEEDTTHFSVVDKEKNMVSMTQSIHHAFGSGVVITGTGILMNNMMRRLNPLSGFATSIGPGKKEPGTGQDR